jgi:hypothetical protein
MQKNRPVRGTFIPIHATNQDKCPPELGELHLGRIIGEYVSHYNQERSHRGAIPSNPGAQALWGVKTRSGLESGSGCRAAIASAGGR